MREKRYYKRHERNTRKRRREGKFFAGGGLELKETERGDNTGAFSIKGKLII